MVEDLRKPSKGSVRALLSLGMILCLLGGSVALCWHLYQFGFFSPFSFFSSMPYNTALAFFMGGLCYVLLMQDYRKTALGVAWGTTLIGSLTLLQYILGTDFGIDQLIIKAPSNLDYPGRMAPSTALCFWFIGTAQILSCSTLQFKRKQLIIRILACLTVGFAIISFSAWMTGAVSKGWASFTRLDGRPTLEFLILGASGIVYAWTHCKSYEGALPPLLPLPTVIAVVWATIFLWQALEGQEKIQFQNIIQSQAEHVKATISTYLSYRLESLKYIVKRWEKKGQTPKTESEIEALSYIDIKSGLKAIEWSDSSFHVRWILPFDEEAKPLDLMYDPSRETTLEGLSQESPVNPIPNVNVVQGGRSFLIYLPLFFHDKYDGFIIGGFDSKDFFDGIIPENILKDYAIKIYGENTLLYERNETGQLDYEISGAETEVKFYGNTWKIHLQPRFHLIKEHSSLLPAFILFFGIFLSVIIFFGVFFAQTTYLNSRKLVKVIKELNESKAKTEEANIAKSAFLANMSHEIRTPLNGVIGMTSLLITTPLDERQFKYVSRIKLSGKVLLEIINDILDFSKIEAGELKIESIPFDLALVVKEVGEIMQPKVEEKNLNFTVVYPESVPHMVLGDPMRVRQVVTNLVSNAIKFTEKGSVKISLSSTSLSEFSALIRCEVQDSGIGIPQSKWSSIFEKFSQADVSTTRKFGGTGLGLAICKQLVDIMKGSIGFVSEENKGSTFWFEIPFNLSTIEESTTEKQDALIKSLDKIIHIDKHPSEDIQ